MARVLAKRLLGVMLVVALLGIVIPPRALAASSAGLFWGPVYVGNLKLYMTNPHVGYAGPKFPRASHVNFHVDKKNGQTYSSVANFHIVKYKRGKAVCLYVWESRTGKTVFDNCTDDWWRTLQGAVNAITEVSRSLLSNADFIAFLAIVGVLIGLIVSVPLIVVA